ncbi:expressed unknown protein (Partial), partial [Seminavis robusta]|eukprot:Sro545_g163960.1 n/a (512) ;mRNA; f:58950-60619
MERAAPPPPRPPARTTGSEQRSTDGGDTSESTLAGDSINVPAVARRRVTTTTTTTTTHTTTNNSSGSETNDNRRVSGGGESSSAPPVLPLHHRREASLGCESDQTTCTAPSPNTIMEEAAAPVVPLHRRHLAANNSTTPGSLPSLSLPSSPSRGALASSEEESVAEFEDVSEEVSVAELSECEGSCSSIETTARNIEEIENNHNPLPSKVAVVPARTDSSTICSTSTTGRRPAKKKKKKSTTFITSTSSSSTTKDVRLKVVDRSTTSMSQDHSSTPTSNPGVAAANSVRGEGNSASQPSPPVLSAIKIPAAQPATEGPTVASQHSDVHRPMSLPKFSNPENCMWTSTHAANCPSEDRSSSLVNVLLQPLPPNFDSETQLPPLEPDYSTLIRLSLWSVIDGHGGGCVATYASEVLLPHIAASISRALGCAIVDRGVCTVNGQLRDANALDLDGLIKTSDRGSLGNPNSIHYRSPFERSDSEEEDEIMDAVTTANNSAPPPPPNRSPPATDEED